MHHATSAADAGVWVRSTSGLWGGFDLHTAEHATCAGLYRVAQARASSGAATDGPERLLAELRAAGSRVQGVQVIPGGPRVGYGLVASQALPAGTPVVELSQQCQLSYGPGTDGRVLRLIEQVPPDLWSARLALQVCMRAVISWLRCKKTPLPAAVRQGSANSQLAVVKRRASSCCLER